MWLPGWASLSIGDKPLWLQPPNSVETSSPGFTPSEVGAQGSFTAVPPTPGHALRAASVPAWPWPLSSESLDLLLQGATHSKFFYFFSLGDGSCFLKLLTSWLHLHGVEDLMAFFSLSAPECPVPSVKPPLPRILVMVSVFLTGPQLIEHL